MVLLIFPLLAIAVMFGGVASLRARLRQAEPARPPIRTRKWIVAGVTALGLGLHVWMWLPLRPMASSGNVAYGGPGDGLLFLFIGLMWFCMLLVSIALACFCARSLKEAALVGSVLLALWVSAGALGSFITRCPEGVTCHGG